MPSSTISGDLGLGPDLDIPQSSLTSSTGMATGALVGDTGLDAYGGTTGTGIASGGLSDVDAYDTSIETVGDLSSSGLGTLDAPSDSGSVMQDDVTSGVTLGSDDVFIANTDLADPDSAEEAQQLGGEDFRSDTTSTDTMPSDDLLARWDAETRGQDDKA
jgi:hypothetical protein